MRTLPYPESGEIAGFASVCPANPLDRPPGVRNPEAGRLVLWSGWRGDQPGAPDRVYHADFATWGPEGRAAFSEFLASLIASKDARHKICFRPHARHTLPDPQSCLNLLRAHESRAEPPFVEVLLDPAGFLTPEMLPNAEEHLVRAFDALAGRNDVPALLLTNTETVRTEWGGELRACPLTRGEIGVDLLLGLTREYWRDKPVLVLDDGFAEQTEVVDHEWGFGNPRSPDGV